MKTGSLRRHADSTPLQEQGQGESRRRSTLRHRRAPRGAPRARSCWCRRWHPRAHRRRNALHPRLRRERQPRRSLGPRCPRRKKRLEVSERRTQRAAALRDAESERDRSAATQNIDQVAASVGRGSARWASGERPRVRQARAAHVRGHGEGPGDGISPGTPQGRFTNEHYNHVSLDEKHKALDAALGSLPGGLLGLAVGVRPNSAPTPTRDADASQKRTPHCCGVPTGAATQD